MNAASKEENQTIVLFNFEGQHYGLYLAAVDRVVPVVEIASLPKAPDIVLGVVNFHGEIIPVINVRKRFNLPIRALELNDQLIIARTSKRLVALVVDSVLGVHVLKNSQLVNIEESFRYTNYLAGIAKVDDDIVLIHDLEKFLSLDEQQQIDKVLSKGKK